MPFEIGQVARSLRGWGFPVKDGKGSLVLYVEFEGEAEAAQGADAMTRAVSGAARIRNTHGQEWPR